MGEMTNYLSNGLLNHLLRGDTFSKPTTLAIALCTSLPTSTATGNLGEELPNESGYARTVYNPSDSRWASPDTGTTTNSSVISFDMATDTWPAVSAIAIVTSATYGEGQCLWTQTIDAPEILNNGDFFTIPVSQLTISFS